MSRLGEPIRSWWLKAARLDLLARVRTPLSIRVWLLALTLSGVLPVLLFAGIATQRGAAAERKIMLADLEHRTESAADAVARHLQSQRELAVTLANSASALAGDLPAFHAYAKRAMAAGKVGRAVVLAEPRGQMLVNTRRPFGEVLPRAGDMQGVTETLVHKTPHIGNLFKGAVSAIHVVTAWALVVRLRVPDRRGPASRAGRRPVR